MKITELNGKNVCILGYGREGKAMVKALETFAPDCEITIADRDTTIEPENGKHWLQVGEGWLKNLEKFDITIKSPGIPPHLLTFLPSDLLTSSTQIFLDTISDRGAITVGVTGSKGKSTTSSLIYAILKTANKDVILTGNIGEPSIAHLQDVKKDTIVVMEMSSYQLMDLKTSPHIAVVTSFFPEHLDYHGSLETYRDAKKQITRFQELDDMVFFNALFPDAAEIAKEGDGAKIPFTPDDSPIAIESTHLIGEHNRGNIAVACMVASSLDISAADITQAVQSFSGLPHRLQSLGVHHGLEWIDDAISTTPESAIAALDALGDRVTTIILGGQDRGNNFTTLAERIKQSSVQTILLFPGSGPRIRKALHEADVSVTIIDVDLMMEAVQQSRVTSPAFASWLRTGRHESREKTLETLDLRSQDFPIVLLSTASPSYGMFKNFEEKGEIFKKCIDQLS